MASEYQYISVVTPPTAAGTVAITVDTNLISTSSSFQGNPTLSGLPESLNPPASASFVLNVSSVTGTETENQFSYKIYTQLGTLLQQLGLGYTGTLAYAEEQYPATFQTTNSDHVTCVWSQCLFTIGVSGNTTGAEIVINKAPCLVTLEDAKNIGPEISFDFTSDFGVALTDSQIITSLVRASSMLTNRLRNNIVVSTYVKELRGQDTDAVKLTPYPVLDFDQPRIRRKNITDVYNLPQWGKFAYGIIGNKKQTLKFRFSEVHIDHREPFSIQNLCYLSFISGYSHIPDEIKTAVVEVVRLKMFYRDGLHSMKGGSNQYVWEPKDTRLERILVPILNYKMRPF